MLTKLKYGNTNTWFLNGLLLDTDMAGTLPRFFQEIKRQGVGIQDVRYVMATHYHPDHMGLISELMDMGVQLILCEHQRNYVHFSDYIFTRDKSLRYQPICEKKATILQLSESRGFLKGIGIGGEIIPTKSHSEDGIALILDDGHCFVGDLEPISYLEVYEPDSLLAQDWKRILKYRPRVIHYGHMNDQII